MTDRDQTAALDRLPSDARKRLELLAAAIERISIEDLPLYAVRVPQPDHRRAVEAGALVAREAGMTAGVEAAQTAMLDFVTRLYSAAPNRFGIGGEVVANLGRPDDRVRVMQTLGDAVAALVLHERLRQTDRTELLGEWARLLP
ncbi:MAG TPA: hypothetical protein VFO73_01820 [Candidatus Limnocylindrales bacterium]|nr:hypothetical protein [Candidatus Limnocylindrales bacterium]